MTAKCHRVHCCARDDRYHDDVTSLFCYHCLKRVAAICKCTPRATETIIMQNPYDGNFLLFYLFKYYKTFDVETPIYLILRTLYKPIGDRAFPVAVAKIWNGLLSSTTSLSEAPACLSTSTEDKAVSTFALCMAITTSSRATN